jgi:hypothetical protein
MQHNTSSLYAMPFFPFLSRGAMPLLCFFHPLLGCNSSLIVAFQEVFQFGINPDKNVEGL